MPLSVLLGPLQNLLNTFQAERHYRDDKKDTALEAINKALIETQRYIEKSRGVNCFDREQEYNLAQLWADAAVKARYANTALAERLQNKSLYWSEELKWSPDEVLDSEIDIKSIQKQVIELLKN